MGRGAFVLGEEVAQFEAAFADFVGVAFCVGVGSGSDALWCALKASGVGPGDEVIVPAHTYIASVLAISAVGATPVLVDCLEETFQIDPNAARDAVTSRTRALLPVHLYGQAADMDALNALARERALTMVEDAAQAHGAAYKGHGCGTWGRAAGFSFYPGKNLGAYGEAGAVVTDDERLASYVRRFRNYGQEEKYRHLERGWNTRLDTLQAAILLVKLQRLHEWNEARRRHADAYRERLRGLPLTLPREAPGNRHVYHLYVIRTPHRDALLTYLRERGVSCGIHYPIPVHLQMAYAHLGHGKGAFPVTEKIASEVLSLPMFPELEMEQIDYVCECIRSFPAFN